MSYKVIDAFVADNLLNQRIELQVPLDYQHPGSTISICANVTQKYDPQTHKNPLLMVRLPAVPKVMAYLQGGPGFPCSVPTSNASFTKVLLERGYQIVYYDQRGTGLSTPIDAELLLRRAEGAEPAKATASLLEYILHFRADSIVRDMEVIRELLLGPLRTWLLLGQSYGGFCCFTYLSMFPSALSEVFVTGGIPPIGHLPDDVYRQTYQRTKERNVHFYSKYPQDVVRVKAIARYLQANRVVLPNGGILSVERFQQLGLRFGGSGGTDALHQIVTELWYSIERFGAPSYTILTTIQNEASFDTNVIYALFQESIYCDGGSSTPQRSNWAADRARFLPGNEQFVWSDELSSSDQPFFFTGEKVFKSMYDDYLELAKLKDLAYALHENVNWSQLYDPQVLSAISWDQVPIVAATYYYDQYVDFDLLMAVKAAVFRGNGNLKQYITSEFFHNGLRANPEKVLGSLFGLRECEVD